MAFAQSGAALRTGELETGFEMLDGHCALVEVDIIHAQGQSL
jgi:hypothetical protein